MRLRDDERDQVLNHGPAYCDAIKVRVGPKTIRFWANDKAAHTDWHGTDTQVAFSKRKSPNGEKLEIEVLYNDIKYDRVSCNLGHEHKTKKSETKYHRLTLSWEYVDQLIEWLQLGSWSQLCSRKSKSSKAVQPEEQNGKGLQNKTAQPR